MVWQKNLKVYEQNGDLLGEWDIPELNPWKKKTVQDGNKSN